ncbi:hypothetical protein, partial [Paraburkholderia sp. BR10954]|uniref:hypothetical protein n=1 Tax=Paraburkholderia sp. BR10954 TaxID=3236995 RepID=UPI0034D39170
DPQEAEAFLRRCSGRFAQPLNRCRIPAVRASAVQNELFRPDSLACRGELSMPDATESEMGRK